MYGPELMPFDTALKELSDLFFTISGNLFPFWETRALNCLAHDIIKVTE